MNSLYLSLEPNLSMYIFFFNIWILNHLRYSVGHVAIFFAGKLLHKVADWTPAPMAPNSRNLTPGRVGNVFFFPRGSLRLLKGKEPNWSHKTGGGRW